MAENKNSILVYADWIKKFEALEDDEAGRLIKHFFRYVNDLNPVAPDRITQLSFIDIEQSLKRDLKKWENKKVTLSDSGSMGNLKRWHADLHSKVLKNEISLQDAMTIASDRKASPPDDLLSPPDEKQSPPIANVAVSVSVSDSVSVIDINNKILSDEKSDSTYKDCIEVYNSFILTKTGVGAKINGIGGKAMKSIICYLKTQVKQKDGGKKDIVEALSYIFKNYNSWDVFHKKQLSLQQIDSNLINIINSIKNGREITNNKPNSKYAT